MSNQIDLETAETGPEGDSRQLTTGPESQGCCHEHCFQKVMTMLYLTVFVADALILFWISYDLVLVLYWYWCLYLNILAEKDPPGYCTIWYLD